jgi:hypothetical protein
MARKTYVYNLYARLFEEITYAYIFFSNNELCV